MTVTEFMFPNAPPNPYNYGQVDMVEVDCSIPGQYNKRKAERYISANLSATIENVARIPQEAVPQYAKAQRSHFLAELKKIQGLPENWNGYASEPPNRVAINSAERILITLHEMDTLLEPKEIVPSAEGGVGILFARGKRRGLIECSNDDEMAAIIYEPGGQSDSWSVADYEGGIKETLGHITAYIYG